MLHAYEATPQPSVLLAGRQREDLRLFGIVLEGFGYDFYECADAESAQEVFQQSPPSLVIVDSGLEEAELVCAMVLEQEDCPMLLLVDESCEEPERLKQTMGASAWQTLGAEPEHLLEALRRLLNPVPAE